jgi:hypothetical protein
MRRRVWSAVPSAPLWLEPRQAFKAKAAKAASCAAALHRTALRPHPSPLPQGERGLCGTDTARSSGADHEYTGPRRCIQDNCTGRRGFPCRRPRTLLGDTVHFSVDPHRSEIRNPQSEFRIGSAPCAVRGRAVAVAVTPIRPFSALSAFSAVPAVAVMCAHLSAVCLSPIAGCYLRPDPSPRSGRVCGSPLPSRLPFAVSPLRAFSAPSASSAVQGKRRLSPSHSAACFARGSETAAPVVAFVCHPERERRVSP